MPVARPRLLAAVVLIGLLPASVATADPAISGADGDSWNGAQTPATYRITGTAPGATITWRLLRDAAAVPGLFGSGTSPLTVTLTGAPEGALTLAATQTLPLDPGRATRAFTIDTVAPTITLTRPSDGGVYLKGDRVLADYSCTGATTCTGPVAAGSPLDTSATGAATFTVSAADAAGNTARQEVGYRVSAAPAPPIQTLTLPTEPGAGKPALPVLAPTRLRPSAGTTLSVRRPVLGWTKVGGARLYNLQVFRVRGATATKVLSVFPTGTLHRIPRGRLAFGDRYVWRVWPLIGRSYTRAPLGQSWFEIQRPVRLTSAQLLVNQRISQAALRRTDAVSAWLDAGLVTTDLRDGGLSREDFAADVGLTGSGTAIQNGVSAPRPVVTAAPRRPRAARVGVTAAQLLINQRISQAAVRRANALARRVEGGLTGGDLRPGAVDATKLAPGLLVSSAQPAGSGPPPSRTTVAAAARRPGARVQMRHSQVLINQRISQAAVRRANALTDEIERGLTGTNFQDGAIAAVSIAPALR